MRSTSSILRGRRVQVIPCLVFIILLLSGEAAAQRLPFGNLRVRDGLPSNYISGIAQDRAGQLWIGTSDGVCVFDGLAFSSLPGQFLAGRHILAMTPDPRSGMWLATGDSLILVRDSSISVYRFQRSRYRESLSAITHVPRMGTWIGSTAGLAVLRGGRLHRVEPPFPRAGVVRMLCDRSGLLWILNEAGVHTYDPKTGTGRTVDSARERFKGSNSIYLDDRGDVYVCARDSSILQFRSGRLFARHRFDAAQPTDLVQDETGGWWIASNNGLYFCETRAIDSDRCVHYTRDNGLPTTRFNLVMMDAEHVLWFGSDGNGIISLEDRSVQVFDAADMTGKGAEDRRGRLWMSGHSGIREYWRDNGRWHEKLHPRQPGWPDGYSYHVQATDDDRLWVSFNGLAIAVFDIRRTSGPDADLPLLQVVMPVPGLPDPDPFCFVVDHRYRLWTKIRISDAAVLDVRKRPVPLRVFRDFHADIRTLYEDRDGTIWLAGYSGGIFFYSDSSLTQRNFHRLPEPETASVRAFVRDRMGRLWIGTMSGVMVESDSGWRKFDTRNGLPNNRVLALAEGNDARMWIATQSGIASISSDLHAVYTHPGLTDSPISACGVQKNGLVWIATAFGLTLYDRTRSRQDTTPPVVLLRGFSVNGSTRQYRPGLRLSYAENNIHIDVATIRMRNAREIRYQYRFLGIDSSWSTPSSSRSISFPALQPASYILEVRMLTAELIPSRVPLRLHFTVASPFWQRWWFYTGLLLFVGLGVAMIYRFRIQRLLAAERLRTQIAADLHDDIGSGLTRIAMLSDVLMHKTRSGAAVPNADAPVADHIQGTISRVGVIARELVESMSDVVWSLDPRNDTVGQLADRLRVFANDLADASDVRLAFTATDTVRRLSLRPEVSRSLLLVIKEALNNIVRHARASSIRVFLDSSDSTVHFIVEDDGTGFDPRALQRRSGLAHMEQRLASCSGHLSISSEPGEGTRISGTVPIGRKTEHMFY